MPTNPKPSWFSTDAESIKAWGLAHWTYLLTFAAGFVMGALIF
jgi:hypothetical protein